MRRHHEDVPEDRRGRDHRREVQDLRLRRGNRNQLDGYRDGKGQELEEALKLTNKAVAEALDGLPPVKMHCSVLAEEALRSAISDYYKRLGKDPAEILGCDADCETCHKAD